MILVFGPYVGSFEQEILTFRPYITWMRKVLHYDKTYVNTHFNRKFLYDDINDNELLPIWKYLSRDELGQKGYIHSSLTLKEYGGYIKELKTTISERENCSKKNIDIRNINYTKSIIQYPMYNKIFDSINIKSINIPDELKNRNIFIPYGIKDNELYKHLKDKYDFIVIGDMSTSLTSENKILEYINYFENGWEYIIGAITHAKVVVCPISFWTAVCNLQKVPVFSWGNNPGQYRKGGLYYFNNKKSMILPDINVEPFLDDFLNTVEGE